MGLQVGAVFNPFSLFDGALVPTEILRSPDLLPSEKLVFGRLMQFAGGKGKAWPSIERIAEEVALSVAQARRCVSALENRGLIRRVARSGRSNEFEFLWHELYRRANQTPHSPVSEVPQSRMSAVPRLPMSGAGHSPARAGGQSPVIGPGHSPVSARRESIESSSSQKIQFEEHQSLSEPEPIILRKVIDDDFEHRREALDDPEQEFLLRLQERHGESVDRHSILHCVLGDLKTYSDLRAFLNFEQKQTTAPEKLKNPAGHYRRAVGKFYESRAKRRDWDLRTQMRALEAKIGSSAPAHVSPKVCPLGRCAGTGECWNDGVVSACDCEFGQELPPKVLAAFEQMNALRPNT